MRSSSGMNHCDDVLGFVPPVFAALREELDEIGIDTEELYSKLRAEVPQRLEKSVRRGHSVAGGALATTAASAAG